jgi:hypothetical protein
MFLAHRNALLRAVPAGTAGTDKDGGQLDLEGPRRNRRPRIPVRSRATEAPENGSSTGGTTTCAANLSRNPANRMPGLFHYQIGHVPSRAIKM